MIIRKWAVHLLQKKKMIKKSILCELEKLGLELENANEFKAKSFEGIKESIRGLLPALEEMSKDVYEVQAVASAEDKKG